ncbi:MAG: VWA domain-containing protein [Anaerolineae bacterium]
MPDPSGADRGTPLRGHHADAQPLSYLREAGLPVSIGESFKPKRLKTALDRMARNTAGKRSSTVTTRKRGRYIYARSADGRYDDIALDATLRQAAPHQQEREADPGNLALRTSDLQRKVRVRKAANLIVFAVDASWSMAAAERMEATKGAILSLLMDAYQKRDRVCLVSFQKDRADLVLPPTSSVEMAKAALHDMPVGGKTPLPAGLLLAHQVIERERRQDSEVMPMLIVLTDGAANVSVTGLPPQEESLMVADMIAQSRTRAVVVNTEHPSLDRGLAQELADRLGGSCYTLAELRADSLYETVRQELKH